MSMLGVFVRCDSNPQAIIHYEISYTGIFQYSLTENSPYVTYDSPYISINTPFGEIPQRTLIVQAVFTDPITQVKTKSLMRNFTYHVEAAARPASFFFLVPGIESGGCLMRFCFQNFFHLHR